LEGGDEEGAGEVGEVVLDVVEAGGEGAGGELEGVFEELRRGGDVGAFLEALAGELGDAGEVLEGEADLGQKVGLGVAGDGDVRDIGGSGAGDLEALANGEGRKAGEVLDAVEAFLGDGRDEAAGIGVEEDGGGVGVEGVETEDEHGVMKGEG
jgi:hypothetical protein